MMHPLAVPEIFFPDSSSVKTANIFSAVGGRLLRSVRRGLGLASREGSHTGQFLAGAADNIAEHSPAAGVNLSNVSGEGAAAGSQNIGKLLNRSSNVRKYGLLSLLLDLLFVPDIAEAATPLGFRPYKFLAEGFGKDFNTVFRMSPQSAAGYIHPYWRLSPEARRALAGV